MWSEKHGPRPLTEACRHEMSRCSGQVCSLLGRLLVDVLSLVSQIKKHRSTPVVKHQMDTKTGLFMEHGATRQRQAPPVPAPEKSAARSQVRNTRAIRLGEFREHSSTSRPKSCGTCKKSSMERERTLVGRTRTRRRRTIKSATRRKPSRPWRFCAENSRRATKRLCRNRCQVRPGVRRDAGRIGEGQGGSEVHDRRMDYHRLSEEYEAAERGRTRLERGWAVFVSWWVIRPRRRVRCLAERTTQTATI